MAPGAGQAVGPGAGPVVLRGRVVTPARVLDDGVLVLVGGRVAGVAPASAWRAGGWPPGLLPDGAPLPRHDGRTYLPGLVDLHCHGGGGASLPDATDLATVAVAAAEHRRHGTTTLVASLVTAPVPVLLARLALLADAVEAGLVAGIHLEGPFLSPARCGAQTVADMRPGDAVLVAELAAAARGHLVTMTVAPEVPGVADGTDAGPASDVLAALVAAGAVPSVGHTDASAPVTEEALARAVDLLAVAPGARSARPTATHLFNGMRPVHHRDAGPVPACLAAAARGELVVELVADGTHLDPALVRSVFDLVGAASVALVTDAMAAAGMADGRYRLGPADVEVRHGVARLARDDATADDGAAGAIAGGTAHLLDVVRAVVAAGVPLVDAVRAASSTPAQVLGRHDVGALLPGRRADVLVTDDALRPLEVLVGGVPLR